MFKILYQQKNLNLFKRFYKERFIDKVTLTFQGGKGGDGCSSFLRESSRPKGGPDGGDGGKGGSVFIATKESLRSLSHLKNPVYSATNGINGQSRNKNGKKGEDLTVYLPVGTVIKYDKKIVLDLSKPDMKFLIASGGAGGQGNTHFATGTNRAPRHFTTGKPGQQRKVTLELKSIADIGLVGYPNAGKSTFLGSISKTQPKVAAYPFTTLNPVIGDVQLEDYSEFSVADMPGLIEGASANVGLGHDFLRHIERTKFLVMVLDISGMEGIGVQELEDGTLKYEFLDPKENPPPNLKENTPIVNEVKRNDQLKREFKINYENLFSDYGIKPEDVKELDSEIYQPIFNEDKIKKGFTPLSIDETTSNESIINEIENNNELNEYDEGYNEYEHDLENEIQKMDEYASHVRKNKENMYIIQPWTVMEKLNKELEAYIPGLSKRVICIVANKIDIPGAAKNLDILKKKTNLPIFPISALNKENLDPLLKFIQNLLREHKNSGDSTEVNF